MGKFTSGNMGRPKGSQNKTTMELREAIIKGAHQAGDGETRGMVNFLAKQAKENPVAYMALLAKILPATPMASPDEAPEQIHRIELVAAQMPEIKTSSEELLVIEAASHKTTVAAARTGGKPSL
jgi:hypothetical protein